MESPTSESPGGQPRHWPLPRTLLYGGVAGLLLAVAGEAGRVFVGGNLHAVVPGRVYRSSQPSPARLERLIRAYGIRTVVNLRGCCPSFRWYQEQCRVTQRLDVGEEDVCFSAGRLPAASEVRRLVEVLDRTEYPILFHCQRGADRTGLASAVALLLHGELPLEEALRQLGPRYGHAALGRAANLDRFFDLYREWLHAGGREHSGERFRRWAAHEYCPAECRAVIEPVELPSWVPAGEPFAGRVRCHNTSVKPWRLRTGRNAGVHLGFVVGDARGLCQYLGRAGLFDAEVAPGESIELRPVVPALPQPGKYVLVLDMTDEQHCSFYQAGSEPLVWEFEVRGQEAAVDSQRGAAGVPGLADRLGPGR